MISIISELMHVVSGSLAASVITKVTVVTVAALVGAWLAPRSPAAVRHVFLAAAFAVLLGLPIASVVAPSIRITVPLTTHESTVFHSFEPLLSEGLPASQLAARAGIRTAAMRSPRFSSSTLLSLAWLIISMLFLVPIAGGLWQVCWLRRSSVPWRRGQSIVDVLANEAGIRRRIDVLLHEAISGPMTCGVVRPTVLLPMDAPNWPEEDLSRAIVHELAHVRRGDWVSQCVARAICACYWFHPLVWVACRRLVLEAERSCDDAVLQRADATTYADQLVLLAKRVATAPKKQLLAMADRGELATRVRAVLDRRQRRGRAGTRCVAGACTTAALLVILISSLQIVTAAQSQAVPQWQTAAGGKMSFDVASVRPSDERVLGAFPLSDDNAYRRTGGLFRASFPLRVYIEFAYKLSLTREQRESWLAQVPKWVETDNFAIQAKAPIDNPTKDQMRLMIQSLLANRFKLGLHFETQQISVFALTLIKPGKLGPQIRPHSEGPPCPTTPDDSNPIGVALDTNVWPGNCNAVMLSPSGVPNPKGIKKVSEHDMMIGGRNVSMEIMMGSLLRLSNMGRPIVDQTGLPGTFDLTLEWTPEPGDPLAVMDKTARTAEFTGTTLSEAVKEQLGMKLESTKAPLPVLVVDHVERPSEN